MFGMPYLIRETSKDNLLKFCNNLADVERERKGIFHRVYQDDFYEQLSDTGRFYDYYDKKWVIGDYIFFKGKKLKIAKKDSLLGYGRIYGVYTEGEVKVSEEMYFIENKYRFAIQLDRLTLFKTPPPLKEIIVDSFVTIIRKRKQTLDEDSMDDLFEFLEEKWETEKEPGLDEIPWD